MDSDDGIDSDPEFLDDQEISRFLDEQEINMSNGHNDVSLSSSSSDDNAIEPIQMFDIPSFYHLKILKKYFGHSNFRPMQWQIIRSLLKDKRDNCAIMSTGYGKSLCYQYPAVYSGGITLVISPLISLMQDQVMSLKVANISACLLGSAQKEKIKILDQIFEKKFSIVYLTPEFIAGESGSCLLGEMRKKLDICLIAVDEAHCISSWGHDFRHQYRKLGGIRELLPGVPILAVTATATDQVQRDIIKSLRLKNPQVLHSGYDRPNLYLEVFHKNPQGPIHDFNKVLDCVCGTWKFPGPTIIYCLTRKVTESIAEVLKHKGINCEAYHAGRSLKDRKEIHEKFSKDQLDCIVATSAFGMGIDKPDIRCVLHYGTPSSLEAYYQEIGRAGRDGESSRCVLFFNDGDFKTHLMIAEKGNSNYNSTYGSEQREEMSNKVRAYLSTTSCRRAFILSYFGENYTSKNDHCCDICYRKASGMDREYEGIDKDGYYDFTEDTEKMLKTIDALKGRYGLATYILFLKGSRGAKLKDEHKQHPLHGCGRTKSDNWWKSIGQLLVQEKYIGKKTTCLKGFTCYLFHLTEKGEEFLEDLATQRHNTKLLLKPPSDILEQLKPKVHILVTTSGSATGKSKTSAILMKEISSRNKQDEIDKKLYTQIIERRNQIADQRDCMPHYVISVPDIKELIRVKPRTLEQLKQCKLEMFSEFKIHQFGQEFIDIIVEELGPGDEGINDTRQSMVEALLRAPLLTKNIVSAEVSYGLLKQGENIQQISYVRGLAPNTIFSHLMDCMKKGLPVKLEDLGVDRSARLIILRAILECPGVLLSPIKEKCPPEITWDQIRAVMMYVKIRDHLEEHQIDYKDFEDFSYDDLKSEAGSLDLNVDGSSQNQSKISTIQSYSNGDPNAPSTSQLKISQEDQELDEFLKVCANLIHEDELMTKGNGGNSEISSEVFNSKDTNRGEKRKIDAVYSSKFTMIDTHDDVFKSPPRNTPEVYKTLSPVKFSSEKMSTEDQELDEFLKLCADIIDEDKTAKMESNNVQQVAKTVFAGEPNLCESSDDEIFRSPPRSEYAMDFPVPLKFL